MILPEPVAETEVPKFVHVTESEPSVTVTVSEPIQKPTQTYHQLPQKTNLHHHLHHQLRLSNKHPPTF